MANSDLKKEELLNEIEKHIDSISYIPPEDIPNIDLYMDQVTTFMEKYLSESKRHSEDKILTKTMINNYAKSHILPSPDKKKYSPEHLQVLIFIYYLKSFMSISDVQSLLSPILDKHFKSEDNADVSDVYKEIVEMCKTQIPGLKSDLETKIETAFSGFDEENDADSLKMFAFLCMLSFDIFKKKQLIEKILDKLY
ncbi:MAG: DUF1836 domain-containing protein [Eubacterium sp.]|nr:DUF1836 domain-containing protein [Eubacterium sp.]